MERNKEIYKVTMVGGAVNVILLLFKFVAGIVGHSAAMVADAVHSLSDFVTDIIVLVFVHISGKPKDKSHDYGHGKYETLALTMIGVALLIVAVEAPVFFAISISAAKAFSSSTFISFSRYIASKLFQKRAGIPSTISNRNAVSCVSCTSPLMR